MITPRSSSEPDGTTPDADRIAADAVYERLLQRLGEGSPAPRLGPTRRAVDLLGSPERAAPVIHLTGTNGKTSTSRMIEALLRGLGLRTGLLTSPHLVRFNERISIDGVPISDADLARNWSEVEPILALVDEELAAASEPALTYFEAFTALAFACFADAPVDVMVLEVGMGGEWDATNVADGQVAVFTPIALDHTDRLGATISAIARTKSGIIKPLANVVSAQQHPEAEAELARAASLREATTDMEGASFAVLATRLDERGQRVDIRGVAATYRDVLLPLRGTHQAQNAAVAVAALETFLGGRPLEQDIVVAALGGVTSPGRFQRVCRFPVVVVDAAHNPHGAQALAATLASEYPAAPCAFVFAPLGDKDVLGIASALAPRSGRFFVSASHSERAEAAERIAQRIAPAVAADRITVVPDLPAALAQSRAWAAEDPSRIVVVTGSIALVGEALRIAAAEGWADV